MYSWVVTFVHRNRDSWARTIVWADDKEEAIEEALRLAKDEWTPCTLRRRDRA